MLSLEDLWLKFFAFFWGFGGIFMSLAFIYSSYMYIFPPYVMVACTFSAPPNSFPPKGPLLGIGKEGKLVVVFSEKNLWNLFKHSCCVTISIPFVSFILWSAFFFGGPGGEFFHCGDPKRKEKGKNFSINLEKIFQNFWKFFAKILKTTKWSIPFLKIYFNLCLDFILKIHACHLKITFIHIKFHLYSFALIFSFRRFRFIDCDNLFAFSSIWDLLSLASYFSSTHVIKPGIYFTTFFFLSISLPTFSPSTFFSF